MTIKTELNILIADIEASAIALRALKTLDEKAFSKLGRELRHKIYNFVSQLGMDQLDCFGSIKQVVKSTNLNELVYLENFSLSDNLSWNLS